MKPSQFLVIVNKPPPSGLMSLVHQVLGQIHRAEREGMTPIVNLNHTWIYWKEGGYRGARNGWEYFFEPVSEVALTEVVNESAEHLEYCSLYDFDNERIEPNIGKKHMYDMSRRGHVAVPPGCLITNRWPDFHAGVNRVIEENRPELGRIFEEYVCVKTELRELSEAFYQEHMAGRRIVGVHMRGAEHNDEIHFRHGKARANEGRYFRLIDDFLHANSGAGIFLATDTEKTVNLFRKRYGNRCLLYDSRRSPGDGAPHVDFGGPAIGEEMLIEAMLLARTDYFLHGISNVAYVVLCMTTRLRHDDVYEVFNQELRRELRWRQWLPRWAGGCERSKGR